MPLLLVTAQLLSLCVAVLGRKLDTGDPIIMCANYQLIMRVSEEKFSRLGVQECRPLSRLAFVFQDGYHIVIFR